MRPAARPFHSDSAGVASLTGVARVLRRSLGRTGRGAGARGFGAGPRRALHGVLPAIPGQRQAGPHLEAVELTPAEKAAFACLVRRLGGGR
jgi:hypothetical protein